MSRTRTLQELRTEVRQRADMVNSAFVTDQLVDRCINQSWAQLYDRLLATGEDYYIKYVDLPAQPSTSSSASAYTLSSVGMVRASVRPVVIGSLGWCVSINGFLSFNLTSGVLQSFTSLSNMRTATAYNGAQYVVMHGPSGAPSVHLYAPITPTPTLVAQTTTWSPALGTQTIPSDSGVFYDDASNEYVTLIEDSVGGTCRVARFTIVGTVATETATSANFTLGTYSALLYMRQGRVAFLANSTFRELNTATLAVASTVAVALTRATGAYDATSQRAILATGAPVGSPCYLVVDVAGQTVVGSIDAQVTAAGGSLGTTFPTSTPDGKWLLTAWQTAAPGAINVGAPAVIEVDPATLACSQVVSLPGSYGLWALRTGGALIANRTTLPLSGWFDTANVVYSASANTSSDFYDFESFTSSTNALATDVYQVRGVDARYSDNVVVNLPRYNWEERNVYNTLPQLTPYYPVTAYRVIQNPLNGKDCIQFIPTTPNGVSSYRVWYYPNPKVLTANTDTIDGRSGWEEWVVVDAAIKLLTIEESYTSGLEREAQRVWARIMGVVENRDAGQGKRITDVNMNAAGWPFPAGYPRRY